MGEIEKLLGIASFCLVLRWTTALTEVFASCPRSVDDSSDSITVTVKSDETLWEVYGFCQPTETRVFGDYKFLDHNDTVTKSLDVFFQTENPDHCRFLRGQAGEAFLIFVEIYLPHGDLHYTVACTYTDGLDSGDGTDVKFGALEKEALITTGTTSSQIDALTLEIVTADTDSVPDENYIHVPLGGPAQSSLGVYLVDVKNQPIGDREWRFGRYLKLAAEMVELRGDEISFQVHTCMALAVGSDQRQFIIKNGCGDGVAIPANRGFTTIGTKAYSVPFKGFHLLDSFRTVFMCTFLMCRENCDGPSCEAFSIHPALGLKRDVTAVRNHEPSDKKIDVKFWSLNAGGEDEYKEQRRETTLDPDAIELTNALGIHSIQLFLGLAFFLSLVSIMTTLLFIAWRCMDTRQ